MLSLVDRGSSFYELLDFTLVFLCYEIHASRASLALLFTRFIFIFYSSFACSLSLIDATYLLVTRPFV